ncbi:MAG: c-type cytochrome [Pseudomonadota bacterium]|nr:c-type cytochrome [Pseudomonadota bacterium]
MRRAAGFGLAISMLAVSACGGGDAGGSQGAAAAGETAFRACSSCHATAAPGTREGDMRLVGPNLHGVVGRPAGSVPGFIYSRAMENSGLVWDEATLDAFLASPQTVVRGTRMSYFGEPDAATRQAIIDYLKTLK